MEGSNFLLWFEKMLLPAVHHLLSEGPVVLFVDGHHSHLSLALVRKARERGVHLMCLPPHATHLLQSLDVGVYGPVHKILARCAGDVGEFEQHDINEEVMHAHPQ